MVRDHLKREEIRRTLKNKRRKREKNALQRILQSEKYKAKAKKTANINAFSTDQNRKATKMEQIELGGKKSTAIMDMVLQRTSLTKGGAGNKYRHQKSRKNDNKKYISR